MRSFPNLIPLSRAGVESIVTAVAPFRFDRIYGAWWDRHIESDAAAAVARSLERYVAAIEGKSPRENTVSINRVSGDAVGSWLILLFRSQRGRLRQGFGG